MIGSGDLFAPAPEGRPWAESLAEGTVLLHGFGTAAASALLAEVKAVATRAPFRHMAVPGGRTMAVTMTNCGALGWVSDPGGYRYAATDPQTGRPWPPMPALVRRLALDAAAAAGFAGFDPDACLINRYAPGTRLSLHQDRDEKDFTAPIVSVSLGLPVTFLLGGLARTDPVRRLALAHGDVLVWGGPDRLRFHGVLPLAAGRHFLLGEQRINLTLRQAG